MLWVGRSYFDDSFLYFLFTYSNLLSYTTRSHGYPSYFKIATISCCSLQKRDGRCSNGSFKFMRACFRYIVGTWSPFKALSFPFLKFAFVNIQLSYFPKTAPNNFNMYQSG